MVNREFWNRRKVFITGHTGFMGGWLSSLLLECGAEISGYALAPPTNTNFFEAVGMERRLASHMIGDVRDATTLAEALYDAKPDIVFHLAAQPLVRLAHSEPKQTFDTNIMGTVNLLEAVRKCPSVAATLVITTDKVYRNIGTHVPYSEDDTLGGKEPYSASKAAAELVLDAYRHSYFQDTGLAAIRAGNIFGGGDWAADRLVPDAVRGFTGGAPLTLRNPASTRPWQHVLDPLPGYLTLAEKLQNDPEAFSSGWNFGPELDDCKPVSVLANLLKNSWGDGAEIIVEPGDGVFEEQFLSLDSRKAKSELNWTSRWRLSEAVEHAMRWYKCHHRNDAVALWDLTRAQCQQILGEHILKDTA
jgi:CDP-glucose 4,6-dehydratase